MSESASSPPSPGPRAAGWRLARRELTLGPSPRLMGVVNVTPDSFSDGGRFLDSGAAVEHGLRLVDEGADLLDVGGESTRPGAQPVSVDEELRRTLPVVRELVAQTRVPVTIDTSKTAVARAALDAGAEAVNDVTAAQGDPDMPALVAEAGCGVCLMHMRGTPRTMQQRPQYGDVTVEVIDFLRARRDALLALGIPLERIAVDPGIGFGKTLEHNLTLLRQAGRLHELHCPVLVGPSRKRFIAGVLDEPADLTQPDAGKRDMPNPADRLRRPGGPTEGDALRVRDLGTIGVALALAMRGVHLLRVHAVGELCTVLRLFEASGGWNGLGGGAGG